MNNKNDGIYLHHSGPCTQCHNGPFKQISSFDDLLNYTRGYPLHMDIPYTLRLKRMTDATVTDEYTILVGDRLIYTKDIDTFLKDQYRKTFNFDADSAENKPVMLDGVPGHIFVQWHYLTDVDVFVERKTLNQIWPVKTGRPPVGLVEFFNKNER